MDEHTQGICSVLRDIVSTASDQDTRLLLNDLFDLLKRLSLHALCERAHRDRVQQTVHRFFLIERSHLIKTAVFFRNFQQFFLIIKRISQLLGNLLSDFTAAASILSSNGKNRLFHVHRLHSVCISFPYIAGIFPIPIRQTTRYSMSRCTG